MAVDQIESELGELTESVRARIADLREALAELGDLHGQLAWTRSVTHASGQTVSPYRASGGFGETLGKLRVVADALDFELRGIEERRRDAAAWAQEQVAFRADEAAKREQRAARAERDADEVKGGP